MVLVNFNFNLKHVILSRMNDLLGLSYKIRKLEIFNFQHNLNGNKILFVSLKMY